MRWPARNPDINPLDFFVWGCMKQSVYRTSMKLGAWSNGTHAVWKRTYKLSSSDASTLCNRKPSKEKFLK